MTLDAIGAHGFEHIERGHGILLKILVRMVEAKADVGIRGQMENKIATGHRFFQSRRIEVVSFDEFETRILERTGEKFILAGGEIVPTDTVLPSAKSQSTRLLPINPAAPVTKTFSMFGRRV